jgi:hypothetical protein
MDRDKWSHELRAEKGNNLGYRSSLRAQLRLPKLAKRFRVVIIQENREEAVAPVPGEPGTPVVNTPTDANALRAVNTELRYYVHDTKAGYAFLAANKYKVAVKYRRNIHRPWLFLELIPEANWLRDEAGGREVIPAFTVRLEINSLGARALSPAPTIVKEQLPIPEYGDH